MKFPKLREKKMPKVAQRGAKRTKRSFVIKQIVCQEKIKNYEASLRLHIFFRRREKQLSLYRVYFFQIVAQPTRV